MQFELTESEMERKLDNLSKLFFDKRGYFKISVFEITRVHTFFSVERFFLAYIVFFPLFFICYFRWSLLNGIAFTAARNVVIGMSL